MKHMQKKKNNNNSPAGQAFRWIGVLFLLSGCATTADMPVTGEDIDPLEDFNRVVFTFNEQVDKAVFKPVARGYQAVMPELLNQGVSNFFGNLQDVVVIANDILQFKFHQATMDTTRVVFNSTFGLLGFFDVASHMELPKHNEDFGQTLGYWGVGPGYYLVLPLFGPSTTRDTVGLAGDFFVHPVQRVDSVRARSIAFSVEKVDTRADLLRIERALAGAALDPYGFWRESYLQQRRNLIYDGQPPPPVKPDFDWE